MVGGDGGGLHTERLRGGAGVRIDAHLHFWRLERGEYSWLSPDMDPLYRDYMPEELLPQLREAGFDGGVLVQAEASVAESEFMLELAGIHDFIKGVVGWLDFESERFSQALDAWEMTPVVGLRPMIHDIEDDAWMLRPVVVENMREAARRGVVIDFLTRPRHLPYLVRLLDEVPEVTGVVDHLSKPEIRKGRLQPWANDLARVAQHPRIMCKLSGLVTEADFDRWTHEDFKPYVAHVVDVFGPRRLVFGSDWPVCLQAASYQQAYQAARTTLDDLLADPQVEQAVFGDNAVRLYGLGG